MCYTFVTMVYTIFKVCAPVRAHTFDNNARMPHVINKIPSH